MKFNIFGFILCKSKKKRCENKMFHASFYCKMLFFYKRGKNMRALCRKGQILFAVPFISITFVRWIESFID